MMVSCGFLIFPQERLQAEAFQFAAWAMLVVGSWEILGDLGPTRRQRWQSFLRKGARLLYHHINHHLNMPKQQSLKNIPASPEQIRRTQLILSSPKPQTLPNPNNAPRTHRPLRFLDVVSSVLRSGRRGFGGRHEFAQRARGCGGAFLCTAGATFDCSAAAHLLQGLGGGGGF